MASEDSSNSRREFWLGVIAVIATGLGTLWSTRTELKNTQLQIAASRDEARRVHTADVLMRMTDAVNNVIAAVQAHGSEYFAIRTCLTKGKEPVDCWTAPTQFDMSVSAHAWNTFDVQLAQARTFLTSAGSQDQLRRLQSIKDQHQRDFPKVRTPRTADEADRAIALMQRTQSELEKSIKELVMSVTADLK